MIFTASPGQSLALTKQGGQAFSRILHLSSITWIHSEPQVPAYLERYAKEKKDNGIKRIKIENHLYEVPEYLILKKVPKEASNILIRKSLYFTRSIIQNRFFIPNNLIFPKSRILLENYFN